MSPDDSTATGSDADQRAEGSDGDSAADVTHGDSAADATHGDSAAETTHGDTDVVVPLRLYKTVTVFSTLIAVIFVVGGFLLLDAATLRASLLRSLVESLLAALGLQPAPSVLSAAFAVAGLAVIGLGAAVYVFGTRFRAPGMTGRASEAVDGEPGDGEGVDGEPDEARGNEAGDGNVSGGDPAAGGERDGKR